MVPCKGHKSTNKEAGKVVTSYNYLEKATLKFQGWSIATDFQSWSIMTLKNKTAYFSILEVGFEKFFDSHRYNYIGKLKMIK